MTKVWIQRVNTYLKQLRTDGFVRSAAVLVGGTAFAQAIGLAALPVLTRLYSPEDFGILAVYTSILSIVGAIACLRFDIAVPISERDDEAINLLGVALLSAFGVALVSLVLVILFSEQICHALRLPVDGALPWLVPAGIFCYGSYSCLQSWGVRRKRFGLISQTRLTQSIAGTATQLSFGFINGSSVGLVVGYIISTSAGILKLGKDCVKHERTLLASLSWSNVLAASRKYSRFPAYSVVEALANSAALSLPVVIIASALPGGEVGQLGLANRIMSAPMALIGTATAQVFLAHAVSKNGNDEIGDYTTKVAERLIKIAVGPFICLVILSPIMFPILFGQEWRRAGVLAAWIGPALLMQLVVSPVSMSLHVLAAQKVAMRLQVFGFLLRVGVVLLAVRFLPSRACEIFAASGLAFYSLYFYIVARKCGFSVSKILLSINLLKQAVFWIVFATCTALLFRGIPATNIF